MQLDELQVLAQNLLDKGEYSPPVILIPRTINKDILKKVISQQDISTPEEKTLNAIMFSINGDDDVLLDSVTLAGLLQKTVKTLRRSLDSLLEKGFLSPISVKRKNCRASKSFVLIQPDIAALSNDAPSVTELPTFIEGKSLFSPLKRGTKITTALADEIVTGILAPCLHLKSKGNREEVLHNEVTVFGSKLQVTTRSYHGTHIAHVLDLRFYIGILTCIEHVMRDSVDENKSYLETFSLPISDIVRASQLSSFKENRKGAVAAINRLRSTTFELQNLPDELKDIYDDLTDAGLTTIDPLSNVSFSRLDRQSGQQIVSFQLPSIIAKALWLRANEAKQSIVRLVSPVMHREKSLLFVFLLQVRRFVQSNSEYKALWATMRDYSSPGMNITQFKKQLSTQLSEHDGVSYSKFNHDDVLIGFEAEINGFDIKIINNEFIFSFSKNSLIKDPLFEQTAPVLVN